MAKDAINFIETRLKVNRSKKFFIGFGVFLLVAGLGTGFFYFQKRDSKIGGQVASATTCPDQKLPKEWLVKYFNTDNECGPEVGGADGDPDQDALQNLEEFYFGTDPTNPDTDNDLTFDGIEVAFNKNPLGEGYLEISHQGAEDYLKTLGEPYDQFSQENIQKQVEQLFQPDRDVVLEIPDDQELIISEDNTREGYEKYYEETKGLNQADELDLQNIQDSLFLLSQEELDAQIGKLQATLSVLKQTPVPSKILNIQKLKVAQITAGIRMFELIRDSYVPDAPNQQFWSDYFYQTSAAQYAGALELIGWKELFDELKNS